ncbi:uncharacterized protein FIBRA_02801 [Fibroporia radiculosa]|uniref:F-box domain-containing protein n=1 Tax=Fibroporia radiculosa TaxID=599839 RepID=J4I993_9APHY|nr:uncharacterized protein FIBRA_02801 [Fibroporia radiculosa]CCM00761.1 predicted protein [Fibroporia radiculosa]
MDTPHDTLTQGSDVPITRGEKPIWETENVRMAAARHNAIVPANRLPNELLVEVVQYIVDEDKPMDLFSVTSVCNYWRDVALATPMLWSTIDTGLASLQCVETFLDRSGDALLRVFMQDFKSKSDIAAVVQAIKSNVERIVHLSISMGFDNDSLFSLPFTLVNAPMERLEHLALRGHGTEPEQILFEPTDEYFPRLHSLRLQSVYVSSSSPRLAVLTSLELVDLPISSGDEEMQRFCDMLDACSQLRSLSMIRVGLIGGRALSSRKVSLPRLRDLTLSAPLTNVLCLLHLLSYPPTTRLTLDVSVELETDAYSLSCLSFLPRLNISSIKTAASIEICCSSWQDFSLRTWSVPRAHGSQGSELSAPDIDIHIRRFYGADYRLADAVVKIADIFSAAPVECLAISKQKGNLPPHVWRDIFSTWPHLSRVELGPTTICSALFDALARGSYGIACPPMALDDGSKSRDSARHGGNDRVPEP